MKKGITLACEGSNEGDYSCLPVPYVTEISEIYRALIQPEQADKIIQNVKIGSLSDFNNEQEFLEFICLHTELALETGSQIRSDIQDLQLEISNPFFSRLMAIKARLMNKAGNYKQAEQILQIAINSIDKHECTTDYPSWVHPYLRNLTMNSIFEACLDLGLWELAMSTSLRIIETSSGEPLSNLNLIKETVLEAEFLNLCEITDVINHKPSINPDSAETLSQFEKYIKNVKSILEPYRSELYINGNELTEEQIYRWQARADIAFKQYPEINS